MAPYDVSEHLRRSSRGRMGGVRRHTRRYLTTEQIAEGRGRNLGRGSWGPAFVADALRDGYAATGPWEIERVGGTITLMHYAFPIARAKWDESVGWQITKTQGRPGYGLSMSDKNGINGLVSALRGHSYWSEGIELPKIGKNPDPRLRKPGPFGSRVSPYAAIDTERTRYREALGIAGASYGPGPKFPARRGRKVR